MILASQQANVDWQSTNAECIATAMLLDEHLIHLRNSAVSCYAGPLGSRITIKNGFIFT
jgi:hypothetical protein